MDWIGPKVEFGSLLHAANQRQLNLPAFDNLARHLRRAKHDRIIDLARSLLTAFPMMQLTDNSWLDMFGARLALGCLLHLYPREHAGEIRRHMVLSMSTIDAELERLGATEHRRIVAVWHAHFAAYNRAVTALLDVCERQSEIQLAALAESVIVGAVFLRNHVRLLLEMLDEQISSGRKRSCQDRFRAGVRFGRSYPWDPTLSAEDLRHHTDFLLDEQLPESPPSELAAIYARVEFRNMRPIMLGDRIGFLHSLLRNTHFEGAVDETERLVAAW